ncbi:MAG: acyltransferase family protein [Anaerolineaceae bacterium]|nr:acyltransferase family protein [Anaerolineaceae bacterium]
MLNKQRDWSLDFLRILSSLLVIMIHTAMYGWYDTSPRTYTWTVLNFYDTLARPAVPIFFMISGSLLLRKDKIDIKKLWLKNIAHLGVIYFVWVVFYAVTNIGVKKALADPRLIWDTVFGPNPQYHLWFLRTLICLYAIAPLLQVLVRSMDGKLFRYFFAIFFVFGLLRKTVLEMPFTPAWLHNQIVLFEDMELVEFSAYFMLGYFLSQPDAAQRFPKRTLWVVYVVTLLLAAGLNQLIAVIDNWPTQAFYGNFSIPVAVEASCLFLLFRKYFSEVFFSPRTAQLIVRISKSTLFVYLVHVFVIQRLQMYLHFYTTDYNVLFSVPLMVILVFVLSVLVGIILERIPILNRIL